MDVEILFSAKIALSLTQPSPQNTQNMFDKHYIWL